MEITELQKLGHADLHFCLHGPCGFIFRTANTCKAFSMYGYSDHLTHDLNHLNSHTKIIQEKALR